MKIEPVVLEGMRVRLEPLSMDHRDALVSAAGDGELWNLTVTVVPSAAGMPGYIRAALEAQALGRELPFAIVDKSAGRVVGSTRYRAIEPAHRRIEIGSTWLSASVQRTAVNTEAKRLLLAHAFEALRAIRVEFVTDVLNEKSRRAIERLGAKQDGILRNHMIMPGGRYRDSACYSIVEAEWPQVKKRLTGRG